MSGLCLAAAGIVVVLPLQDFTLGWMHSIEKIRWEEDYRIVGKSLLLTEARIRGSGAGMEPPEGAALQDGAWRYRPQLAPLERLRLTRSPYAEDYSLCERNACRPMSAILGPVPDDATVELFACGLE